MLLEERVREFGGQFQAFVRYWRRATVRNPKCRSFSPAGGLFFTIHYAWLLDDAFVYFRYVDNALFLGRGLVYNAGEYVEGYSSPFWTLLLLVLRSTSRSATCR